MNSPGFSNFRGSIATTAAARARNPATSSGYPSRGFRPKSRYFMEKAGNRYATFAFTGIAVPPVTAIPARSCRTMTATSRFRAGCSMTPWRRRHRWVG
jgi:hypothetical protein